ncbi:MAG: NAD-dependent epimerase/dehydratase family protein, partial [Desulfobacterales bacterium]
MRIMILGGDGYLGWPTAMHLSAHGHEVAVADNYLRRRLCREEQVDFLHAVPDLDERAALWQSVSGHKIAVHRGDLSTWDFVAEVFEKFNPQAVVHYAEQPSAPYSMLNRRAATLTLQNNLSVTANVIFAVK